MIDPDFVRSLFLCLLLQTLSVIHSQAQSETSSENSLLIDHLESIEPSVQAKLYATFQEFQERGDSHPAHTDFRTGRWVATDALGWTSGFFAGQLWQIYQLTGNSIWSKRAHNRTVTLDQAKYVTSDHDNGFRMMPSYGLGLQLTGNLAYLRVLQQAAHSLAGRYKPAIGAIKSWDWTPSYVKWQNPVIIDNMMNLELLFRVSLETGNNELYNIAYQHALTTLANHFRDDGSTFHIVDFSDQGAVLWKGTVQGYGRDSVWARGQSWAIYGFTVAFRFTRDPRFLEAAQRAADYYLDNLPDDSIPFYDFKDPSIPNVTRDVSSAAITASALLELYGETAIPRYLHAAESMLLTMSHPPYFVESNQSASILTKGTRHRGDPEIGLVYGDYYFLEAWIRYLKIAGKSLPQLDNQHFNYLGQNYPNPFKAVTTIPYTIEEGSHVQIRLYDLTGRLVSIIYDGYREPGSYYEQFEPEGLSTGIYIYQLIAEPQTHTKKLLIFN